MVRDHVNEVMGSFTADEQALCAKIFDRLVTAIGGKIAYPVAALAVPEVVGPGVSEQAVTTILEQLTDRERRILKPVMTDAGAGFEIFHDVLGLPVLEWKRNFDVKRQVIGRQKEESLPRFAHSRYRRDASPGRVKISNVERLLDNFFKVDKYEVSFQRYTGGMSPYFQRLNFERGDAVGVFAYNIDTRSVVVVEQFKLPTLIGRRRDDPRPRTAGSSKSWRGWSQLVRHPSSARFAKLRKRPAI